MNWKEKAIGIVATEEELDGQMPPELETIDREELCRYVVRATKRSIIRRIMNS